MSRQARKKSESEKDRHYVAFYQEQMQRIEDYLASQFKKSGRKESKTPEEQNEEVGQQIGNLFIKKVHEVDREETFSKYYTLSESVQPKNVCDIIAYFETPEVVMGKCYCQSFDEDGYPMHCAYTDKHDIIKVEDFPNPYVRFSIVFNDVKTNSYAFQIGIHTDSNMFSYEYNKKRRKMQVDQKAKSSPSVVSTEPTQTREKELHEENAATDVVDPGVELSLERIRSMLKECVIRISELSATERAQLDKWAILIDATVRDGFCWGATYLVREGDAYYISHEHETYGGWGWGPSGGCNRQKLNLEDKYYGYSGENDWVDAISEILDDEANDRLDKYTVFTRAMITCGPVRGRLRLDELVECLKPFEGKNSLQQDLYNKI